MTLDIFALLVVIKEFYSCFVYMSIRSTCAFLFVQDPVNLTHFLPQALSHRHRQPSV